MGVTRMATIHIYDKCIYCPCRKYKSGECSHEKAKPGNRICYWKRKVKGKDLSCPKDCPLSN